MLDKKQIECIKRVGRNDEPGGASSIHQGTLDALCDTAQLGLEAIEFLEFWYDLRKKGYSLRTVEVQRIYNLLERVRISRMVDNPKDPTK